MIAMAPGARAANNIWDNSDSDNDGSNVNNWSLGHVPTTGEVAYFDDTSDATCDFITCNVTCDGINATSDYDGNIDFGSGAFVIGSDGIVLDHTGDLDWGTGTIEITDGNLDYADVGGTMPAAQNSLTLNGTVAWLSGNWRWLNNLTVNAGAVVTHTGGGYNYLQGGLVVNGTLDLGNLYGVGTGPVSIGNSGVLTGNLFSIQGSCNWTAQDGIVSLTTLNLSRPGTNLTLPPATYNTGKLKVSADFPSQTLRLSSGTYIFGGDFEMNIGGRNDRDGALILDNATNGPNITVTGDLTFNLLVDGWTTEMTVDNSSQAVDVDWNIQGDVIIVKEPGDATMSWTKGTGSITLSGANAQDIDFDDLTIEDIVINKTNVTNDVTFSDGWTSDSFDAQKGTVDFNGETFVVSGDFTIGANSTVTPSASTIIFNKGARQYLTSKPNLNLGHIHLQNASTYLKMQSHLICQDLTLDAGTTFDHWGYGLNIQGTFTNNGRIIPSPGTLIRIGNLLESPFFRHNKFLSIIDGIKEQTRFLNLNILINAIYWLAE